MKFLVTGANGQVGWELQRTVPDDCSTAFYGSAELDITDAEAVTNVITVVQPDVIVNAAAYTAVDKAESEKEKAHRVNCDGVVNLGKAAGACSAKLVHISTDFVFDGQKSSPYLPGDPTNPLGVYGQSKLEGEIALSKLDCFDNTAIIRTSWVYSSHGNNFVKTMLRLMGEREQLGVVADQVGSPTWAHGLAQVIWKIIDKNIVGKYHYTDSGVASWYDFASAVYEEAKSLDLLTSDVLIKPINTTEYPTPAQRPPYSVLDKTSLTQALCYTPVHWRSSLRSMLKELKV